MDTEARSIIRRLYALADDHRIRHPHEVEAYTAMRDVASRTHDLLARVSFDPPHKATRKEDV